MSLSVSIKSWLGITQCNEDIMLRYADTSDVKYLEILITRLGDDLYHYLCKHSDPQLAQDISQQTWMKVIEKRRSFADTGTVKAWLFKMARNTLIDEYRKQKSHLFDEEVEVAVNDASVRNIAQLQQQQRFSAALAQLSFYQREAFVLQQEGFRMREISQLTQADMETVKSRLRYARSNLKKLLQLDDEVGTHE